MLAVAGILAALAVAPGHAEIAYVSEGAIWSSRADGSERQLLVAAPRGEELSEPVWSPDGTALAYVREVPGVDDDEAQIMLRDAGGTRAVTPLQDRVYDFAPAWSPDGATLAFGRFLQGRRSFRTQLVTRNLASGDERVIASTNLFPRFDNVSSPAWSPDGSTIAYTHTSLDRSHYFRHAVRVIPAMGGSSRLLLRQARSPAWSPDGTRIAFASIRDRNGRDCGSDECSYNGELYTAAADGTGLTRITRNAGDDDGPRWAPDGSRILFTSDRNMPDGDGQEVYSVAADGTCLTWLTNGTPGSGMAAWRPGSGTRFDPGTCDPNARPARVAPPAPAGMRDRLWLGARYRGLLLSSVDRSRGYLAYDDCEHFDPRRCPAPIGLSTEPACRYFTFRGLVVSSYRFVRRRGALVAFSGDGGAIRLFSGHAVTSLYVPRGEGRRVLRRLRPLDATEPPPRLEPPRIPRELAPRLERTARTYARLGSVEATAEARGISRLRTRGHLRLRAALRSFGPYRFSSCEQ